MNSEQRRVREEAVAALRQAMAHQMYGSSQLLMAQAAIVCDDRGELCEKLRIADAEHQLAFKHLEEARQKLTYEELFK